MSQPGAERLTARGERKFAVMLFADLTGYTRLCSELDPEDVLDLLAPVMQSLRQIAQQAGGVILNLAGDGFLAVFGVPSATPDAVPRAVRSAWRMCEVIDEAQRIRGSVVPDVHIGLAAGEVLVAPSDLPLGWDLVGAPVNLASRLCAAAAGGEILADQTCRSLAGPQATWSPPRRLQLRGLSQQVAAWVLLDLAAPAAAEPEPAPLVGRAGELRALDRRLEASLSEGVGRVVLVQGHAGIGKSALLRAWVRGPVAGAVPGVWQESSSVDTSLPTLEAAVAAMTGRPPSGPVGPGALEHGELSNPQRADPFPAYLAGVRRRLEEAAGRRGLVVVVEDLHQADPATLALVRDLAERPLGAPVTVVATWRTDEGPPPWPPDIQLAGLAREEFVALLARRLGGTPVAEIVDAISAGAQGHPLMAVMASTYLVQNHLVATVGGECLPVGSADLAEVSVPLELFVAARIDQLPAAQKACLQEVSVLGEVVDVADAQALLGPDVRDQLAALHARGLLGAERAAARRFSHQLIQQVAYGSLPRSRRRVLHRLMFERLAGGPATGARAFHARAWALAQPRGNPSERRTAARAAIGAALEHAEELFALQAASALAAVESVAPLVEEFGASAPAESASGLTLGAACLTEMGRFSEALRWSEQAQALCVEDAAAPILVRAQLAGANALSRLRRFAEAREVLERTRGLVAELDDALALAHVLRLTGDTWRQDSFPTFLQLVEEAHDAFTRAGHPSEAADCARYLAYLTSASDTEVFQRWWSAASSGSAPEDLRAQAWLARAQCMASNLRSDFTTAAEAARRAVELGDALGAPDFVADGLYCLVVTEPELGRLEAALVASERFCALAEATGNPRMTVAAWAASSLPLARTGRLRAARDAVARCRRLLEQQAGATRFDELAWQECLIERDRGEFAAALDLLEAAHASARDSGFDLALLSHEAQRLRLLGALSRPPADGEFQDLVARCQRAGAVHLASYVRALGEQAAVERGERLVPGMPVAGSCLEELCIRADTQALLAGRRSPQDSDWARAAQLWQQLGATIWTARAQQRSGDGEAAARTLDALEASPDARGWVSRDPAHESSVA